MQSSSGYVKATLLVTVLFLLLPVCVSPQSPPLAAAQSKAAIFDLETSRNAITIVDAPWRFRTGDDPDGAKGWAKPEFDDSSWALFDPNNPGKDQNFSGMAWFRLKVRVPADEPPLSIYLYAFTSAQVFADEHLIGTYGQMLPQPRAIYDTAIACPLPVGDLSRAHVLTFALRVWNWPAREYLTQGGPGWGIRIGPTRSIDRFALLNVKEDQWSAVSQWVLLILESFAVLTGLALFAIRRREPEYLWFALILLSEVGHRAFFLYIVTRRLGVLDYDLGRSFFAIACNLASVALFFRLLSGRRDRFFWIAMAGMAGVFLVVVAARLGMVSGTGLIGPYVLCELPAVLWILTLLVRRVYRRFPDAAYLTVPVLLSQLANYSLVGYWFTSTLGWKTAPFEWINMTIHSPFEITFRNIADALFLGAMLAILIHRFTRTSRQEDEHHREREAARTVQQILLPEAIPSITGFHIVSVYRPFGEVGGDFFQILPIESGIHAGSVLIVIGDVSGKGLPAAMTVSLLVGTFRTYAEFMERPAELLEGLNHRLYGRSSGFTTCVILRASPDGEITVANAGHIPPYMNGAEFLCENGLPLGLTEDAIYTETTIHLSANQQLTLVTDGVVEARTPSGELFGFERTAAISLESAESIVSAAQAFGQDDDITVLTLTRHSSSEPITLLLPNSVPSPSLA